MVVIDRSSLQILRKWSDEFEMLARVEGDCLANADVAKDGDSWMSYR
jgi:hypothetical protein